MKNVISNAFSKMDLYIPRKKMDLYRNAIILSCWNHIFLILMSWA